MIKVGLTGGIGSGKSYIANIFSHLGVPIYYADVEAKKLYDNDDDLLQQVRKQFGNSIIGKNNMLDRKALAAIVFSNPSALAILNTLVHPALQRHFEKWLLQYKHSAYVIQEAAILFESGFDKLMDKIAVVTAPNTLRIQRVVKRDGITPDEVEQRMKHQLPQEELTARADFVITADGKQPLLPQVLSIHNKLCALSKATSL